MKILVIGASGTIGKTVYNHFKQNHEVISASRNSGDYKVDISLTESLESLFKNVGKVDAIANCAGSAKWNDFNEMTEEDFYIGIKNKMMGQVNLTRIGKDYLNENGSITLITGVLGDNPVLKTSGAALVNGAINSFVKAVAMELRNGLRINVVSPGLVEDSVDVFGDYFGKHNVVTMEQVVNGFRLSVEGKITGEVIRVY